MEIALVARRATFPYYVNKLTRLNFASAQMQCNEHFFSQKIDFSIIHLYDAIN
jgi:hypothetical protein